MRCFGRARWAHAKVGVADGDDADGACDRLGQQALHQRLACHLRRAPGKVLRRGGEEEVCGGEGLRCSALLRSWTEANGWGRRWRDGAHMPALDVGQVLGHAVFEIPADAVHLDAQERHFADAEPDEGERGRGRGHGQGEGETNIGLRILWRRSAVALGMHPGGRRQTSEPSSSILVRPRVGVGGRLALEGTSGALLGRRP